MEAVSAGQDIVMLNPVVVLGPGDLNKISGEMILQIQRLSWTVPVPAGGVALIDVRDVARMHVAAARQGRSGERYILGTENLAYRDLFRLIARVTGSPEPGLPIPASMAPALAAVIDTLRTAGVPLPLDAPQTRLSAQQVYFTFDKAWNELGKPLISIPQSVRETWEWYAAHGFVKLDDPAASVLTQIARWIGFA